MAPAHAINNQTSRAQTSFSPAGPGQHLTDSVSSTINDKSKPSHPRGRTKNNQRIEKEVGNLEFLDIPNE
jgi:hypothetical protein